MTKNNEAYPQMRFKGFNDDWKQRKVSELADRYDNLRVPITASERVAGETPYYGANGIQDYVEGFTHDGEFILVAEDGANDLQNYPVQYVDGKVWVNNHAHVLQAKEETVDNKFLMSALKHTNIEPYLVGGGRAKLNADVMMKIDFKVPKLLEQVQLGKFFDNLDHLITLHKRKLAKLKELKKGYLQKLFPKQGEKVPELRFKGFDDAWEQRKFGDLYKKNLERNNNQFKVDRTISIATMRFRQEGNGASENSLSSYRVLREGDIAFEGHTSKKFAFGRFVLNDIGDGIMSPRFTTLRPNKEMPIKFWKQYIHYEPIMRYPIVNSTKLGTMMNELVVDDFLKQCVLVPSLEEQKKIGHFFQQLNNLVTLHQRELDLLEEQKKGYLQKMFC